MADSESSSPAPPDGLPSPATAPEQGPTVLCLRGQYDTSTDGELSRLLARAIAFNGAPVVLDLSEVGFISASTFGVIVMARNSLRQQSRSLTVRSPSGQIRRVIGACGLDDLLSPSPAPGPAGDALGSWVAVPPTERADRQPGPSTVAAEQGGQSGNPGAQAIKVERKAPALTKVARLGGP